MDIVVYLVNAIKVGLVAVTIVSFIGFRWYGSDWDSGWAWVMSLTIVAYIAVMPIDIVLSLIIHDWFGAVIDIVFLILVFWDEINRRFKKWRKRAKEKIAVIKGRLKVVPIPAPA